jgi:hypothetical protein
MSCIHFAFGMMLLSSLKKNIFLGDFYRFGTPFSQRNFQLPTSITSFAENTCIRRTSDVITPKVNKKLALMSSSKHSNPHVEIVLGTFKKRH